MRFIELMTDAPDGTEPRNMTALRSNQMPHMTMHLSGKVCAWSSRVRHCCIQPRNSVYSRNSASSSDSEMLHRFHYLIASLGEAFPWQKRKERTPRFIHWTCPAEGWLKLNVDGSSLGNPGPSGAGGLLRDQSGVWKIGFSLHLGCRTNMYAELYALRFGLQLTWDEGCRHLIVETYSLEANHLIQGSPFHRAHRALLLDIRSQLAREWQCSIQHTLREANQCADFLAKLGAHYCELCR